MADPEFNVRAQHFDHEFLYRFSPILDVVSRAVVAERLESQWLVDIDVIEVYKALTVTMKTLASGIYYESAPEGAVRQALFRRLTALFDQLMQPQDDPGQPSLKISEALDILDFLTLAAETNSSLRPRSRRYLDWLTSMAAPAAAQQPSSGLIIP